MAKPGFFVTLLDFSFTEFITIRVVGFLYALGIIAAAIAAIALIVSGFRAGVGEGVGSLILAPLVFLLYVLVGRIWLEVIVVMFRIAENTERLVERAEGQAPASPTSTGGSA